MYKKRKYNAVLSCLIIIIALVVGISAGMGTGVGSIDVDDGNNGEVEVPIDQESGSDLPAGFKRPTADSSARVKLDFALKILNEGYGYRSKSTQDLKIKALNITQKMAFKKYRGDGFDVAEEFFRPPDGMFSSAGKNEARVQFSDGKNMYVKTISDPKHFDFNARTYTMEHTDKLETFTVNDWVNVQNRVPVNDFYVNVDKDSIATIMENKISDKDNYIIKVSLNVNKLSSKYLATFTANGGGSVQILSINLEFRISKKTFFLTSSSKNEIFKATYAGFAESECQNILKETYEAMNASQSKTIKDIALRGFGLTY